MIVRRLVRSRPSAPRRSARLAAPPVAAATAAALTLLAAAPFPAAQTPAIQPVQSTPDAAESAEPGGSPGTADDVPRIDSDEAVLRWLDKSTARVAELAVPVGTPVTLGGVEVTARACRRTAPDQTPEHAAFLSISELNPGEAPRQIFQGWMFASSPSLAALEHPVYDVWVLECRDTPDAEAGASNDASSAETTAGSE